MKNKQKCCGVDDEFYEDDYDNLNCEVGDDHSDVGSGHHNEK